MRPSHIRVQTGAHAFQRNDHMRRLFDGAARALGTCAARLLSTIEQHENERNGHKHGPYVDVRGYFDMRRGHMMSRS